MSNSNFQNGLAHFELSIDGVQILSARSLTWVADDTRNVAANKPVRTGHLSPLSKTTATGRNLLAHELTHVVQQSAGSKPVSIRIKATHPKSPNIGRLRTAKGRYHTLTAIDRNGRKMGGFKALAVETKEDVLQQEWSIVYETIQRVV